VLLVFGVGRNKFMVYIVYSQRRECINSIRDKDGEGSKIVLLNDDAWRGKLIFPMKGVMR